MAIAFVQSVGAASSAGALSLGVTITPTSGNNLIGAVKARNLGTTISGPSGWTQAVHVAVDNTDVSIWYLENFSGSGSQTYTWSYTGTADSIEVIVAEFSGLATSSSLDQTATNTNGTASTTVSSGTTATTASANELWFAALSYDGSATRTWSAFTSGFTQDKTEDGVGGHNTHLTDAYDIASSTGAATCSATISSAQINSGVIATFKAVSGTAVNKDVTTRGRLSALVKHDITTRGRLSALGYHDLTVRGNIGNTAFKDITVRGLIKGINFHDITTRGRIGNTAFKDITARGRIGNTAFKDITVRGRIGTPAIHDLTTRGRLSALGYHDLTVRGNIISRNLSGTFTCWANGTGTAQFDSFRGTLYPDPSAPMTNAGRANTSSVNWTANVPTNTTLATATSTDNGATFQTAPTSGNDVAGISTLLYSTLILQRKPVGYWHLGESVSPSLDSSGNGYSATWHGTITGSQAGALAGPGEASNTALLLDGSTGYLSVASGLKTDGWSNFWVGCWFKPSASLAYAARLIANDNPASTHNGIDLGVNASLAGCFFTVGNGTTSATATFSTALPTGKWSYLVGVFDGVAGTLTLYLNGVQQATASLTGSVGTAANALDIGQSPAVSGKFFQGTIDEVDITNPTIANSVPPLLSADVLARYNASLVTGMATILDTFASNSSANYTQGNYGGTTGSWTWDTTNTRLTGSGGNGGTLAYTSAVQLDGQYLLDADQADGSGLFANLSTDVAGNKNLYYLQVFDGQAASNANTLKLFKRSGGVLTQLGSTTSITFPRGTYHHFELDVKSGVLTVSMNGVQLLQQTDATPLVAGQAGLLLNTLLRAYTFQITQLPRDLSFQSLSTKLALSTTDPTATPQVTTHSAAAFGPRIDPGIVVPQADYRDTLVGANHDDLAQQSNYDWYTDPSGSVWFKQRNAQPAPWIAQSSAAGNAVSGLEVEHDSNFSVVVSGDLYRNRQVITNCFTIFSATNTFTGSANAEKVNFTLNYDIAKGTVPTITRNGVKQTVAIEGTGTAQFYYKEGDKTVKLDQNQPDVTALETVVVTYTAQVKTTVQADNTAAQTALAAVEGGTGIVEQITDGKGIDSQAATTLANQLLTRYSILGRTLTFKTYRNGLVQGQIILVNIPEEGLVNVRMYITEVDLTMQTLPGNQMLYGYIVTCTELPNAPSWAKLISSSLID